MRRLPADFAALLTPKGRRALSAPGTLTEAAPFAWIAGAIGSGTAAAMEALLEKTLAPHLVPLAEPIAPELISRQTRNYMERLPKVARLRTAYLERTDSRAWRAAERIGLITMLGSSGLRRLAEAAAGRRLDARPGFQLLRYGPGDYQGPHTDHHPEDRRARDGYIDIHVSLPSPDVADQFMVFARKGHLSEMVNVAAPGGIAVYRLPFWHLTTPLRAKRGRARDARRWVILGTFLFAE